MKTMVNNSIKDAFAGESQAHMKYLLFSEIAGKEGFPNVARLFKAIAFAEQVHAFNHARKLGMGGTTGDNLQAGIDGETFEVEEMYPAYDAMAKSLDDKEALRTIFYALEAEKVHAVMYQDARERVLEGKDIDGQAVHVCSVCGYTHIGEPPDCCPVCKVPRTRFQIFA
ncbi:MAG TPA: rubrerythrin family protein [Thermoanaerobaculia bacterium]|nr:rubrerythrin family protein [Thermoanaerobaculia bacterium]HUM29987.1 rubrerythrin family protein [Thermoanaerobaculia bacterium]HXK68324.1 rubrerythrin family protein [Thermoanaerobaculia bacterium]